MSDRSKAFAESIFSLAVDSGSLKKTDRQFDIIAKLFSDNPEYCYLLQSPSIPKSERLNALDDLLKDGFDKNVVSFMCILVERNAIFDFGDIVADFKALYREYLGLGSAVITSAVELTDDEKARLISKLEKKSGKKLEVKYVVDETIIGGLVVDIDGKFIDASVKTKLEDITSQIKE
ncbi:MAG TPA: ATP synthase F1 subunit delta [Clostridiales bacterium]|nr:ATP synthase F1 subunit delta [Clostridiales bacterium]